MSSENTKQVEVIFSPALFEYRQIKSNYIIVIVDILRATTSICTAFEWGVNSMIPVKTINEAREYKNKGFMVAGERIEETFEFADLGNGANEFMTPNIKGKDIVHSTTNGTVAISMAQEANPNEILIGAFSNISTLAEYLLSKKESVVILCSGWKNSFCIEDSVFAGALLEKILEKGCYINHNDSAYSAIDLWTSSKQNLMDQMQTKASHMNRLRKHKMDDVFPYTYTFDTCNVVPKLYKDILKDALREDINK
ncbi:MAG: 2-phosphosulfolactate phosphatase [Bacteroidales bacterium]|jgi:2-phosphosulfolactate phosphatase|nr:2-phosphosulfolactate phosphatase [Bacteroidales bacterium]MDD4528971.1 2-phosphosulfolactate phosphatase [Bacteroidales bacterium]MDD4830114.1 2-phosphosulfolactate phosphatase [Bacteroidales bacterium]